MRHHDVAVREQGGLRYVPLHAHSRGQLPEEAGVSARTDRHQEADVKSDDAVHHRPQPPLVREDGAEGEVDQGQGALRKDRLAYLSLASIERHRSQRLDPRHMVDGAGVQARRIDVEVQVLVAARVGWDLQTE